MPYFFVSNVKFNNDLPKPYYQTDDVEYDEEEDENAKKELINYWQYHGLTERQAEEKWRERRRQRRELKQERKKPLKAVNHDDLEKHIVFKVKDDKHCVNGRLAPIIEDGEGEDRSSWVWPSECDRMSVGEVLDNGQALLVIKRPKLSAQREKEVGAWAKYKYELELAERRNHYDDYYFEKGGDQGQSEEDGSKKKKGIFKRFDKENVSFFTMLFCHWCY
ncbi:unnamed protein product [Bursaphelenchus okinawaensis]|uniref:Uncharacterized protein n=1 Tax=Bursaphelenchus okinawaensis TaxID=465554 RepID=A0A811JRD6_9BILA|nr:unnamed protein product [Bursaphelenchus okinawaensis]CAG9079455.1 unnamed protein product [Bursaphelenchus okinawaensis]